MSKSDSYNQSDCDDCYSSSDSSKTCSNSSDSCNTSKSCTDSSSLSSCSDSKSNSCTDTSSCSDTKSCSDSSSCSDTKSCSDSSSCSDSKSCSDSSSCSDSKSCSDSSSCSDSKSCSDSSSCSDSKSCSNTKSCGDSSCSDSCDSVSSCTNTVLVSSSTESNSCDDSSFCEVTCDDKLPLCCPEDCDAKKKCDGFNIYWFGAGYSDPGNARLVLGTPEFNVENTEIPGCPEINTGTGPCGRSSNGKVYPQFLAEDLGFDLELQYDLEKLPKGKNNLVSFALAGSSQNKNLNTLNLPGEPSNDFGFDYQVDKYLKLYCKSQCYAIPEKDVFFYTGVGLVEQDIWFKQLLQIPVQDWNDEIVNVLGPVYISQTMTNIKELYNCGKARRMFVQLADAPLNRILPLWNKLECAVGTDALNIFNNAISTVQDALKTEIENYALQATVNLDVSVVNMSGPFVEIHDNPSAYGVTNAEPNNMAFPLIDTMISFGWPDQVFENMMWFDDVHPSDHTHSIVANFVKTWL